MRHVLHIDHGLAAVVLACTVVTSYVSASPLTSANPGNGLYKAHYHSMDRPYAPVVPYAPIARVRRVSIANERFIPAQIVIFPGQTVIWRNNDDESHTVTARGGRWDSGVLPPGARFRLTFRRPGIYYYFCKIHPFMHGRIVVRR